MKVKRWQRYFKKKKNRGNYTYSRQNRLKAKNGQKGQERPWYNNQQDVRIYTLHIEASLLVFALYAPFAYCAYMCHLHIKQILKELKRRNQQEYNS